MLWCWRKSTDEPDKWTGQFRDTHNSISSVPSAIRIRAEGIVFESLPSIRRRCGSQGQSDEQAHLSESRANFFDYIRNLDTYMKQLTLQLLEHVKQIATRNLKLHAIRIRL